VIIASDATPARYTGNSFSILGGPDGGTFTDFNDLGDVPFAVTVQSPSAATAEPNSFWLVLSGAITFAAMRWRQRTLSRPSNSGNIES
jgi:hypothetical protein